MSDLIKKSDRLEISCGTPSFGGTMTFEHDQKFCNAEVTVDALQPDENPHLECTVRITFDSAVYERRSLIKTDGKRRQLRAQQVFELIDEALAICPAPLCNVKVRATEYAIFRVKP